MSNLTPYAAAMEAEKAGQYAEAARLYLLAGDQAGGHNHAANCYAAAARLAIQAQPAKPTIAERHAQLAALPASDLVAEYARTYYCAGQTPTAHAALWTILRGEYGADEAGALERELGRQEGAQHTPGPWTTSLLAPTIVQIPGRDGFVEGEIQVFGHGGSSYEEACANARLIAAAPDLLAACQSFTAMYRQGIVGTQLDAAYHAMTAAIAKATLSTVG